MQDYPVKCLLTACKTESQLEPIKHLRFNPLTISAKISILDVCWVLALIFLKLVVAKIFREESKNYLYFEFNLNTFWEVLDIYGETSIKSSVREKRGSWSKFFIKSVTTMVPKVSRVSTKWLKQNKINRITV